MSGWYDSLPVFAQNWVCDAYGLKMRRQRFNHAFERKLEALMETDRWRAGAIAEFQDESVRGLVAHAYQNVPFYRERWKAAGIQPGDIRGVADLPLLPITTKEDVRRHGSAMRARNTDARDLIEMHTSGTTGTALSFDVDRAAIPFRWAVWWRHRVRFGVRPGEWHVNFTGKLVVPSSARRPPYWRRSRPLRQYLVNMQHLTSDKIQSLATDLDVHGPRFFSGYPSIVHVYCRLVAEAGITLQRPPAFVFTGAENVLDQQRRDVHAVTGAVMTDQYGFTEGCGNASHCERFVYHEDFEYGVLECNDPVTLPNGARQGRIVATGFASPGFPLIRYDVGDVGTWAPDGFRCECGRESRVLLGIEGRVDDYVITPEGRRIMRFDYVFKETAGVREAQILQERIDTIRVALVFEPTADRAKECERIRAMTREWISPTIRVEFDVVDKLPRKPNGKLQAVVSRLPRETGAVMTSTTS